MSLLNVAVSSTVTDFPTVCSGDPTADDIHDVPIDHAAAVISDVNSVPAYCSQLHYFCKNPCFCCCLYCVGGPVVAFIPAVACFPAVVNGHDIAVILAVTCCWCY